MQDIPLTAPNSYLQDLNDLQKKSFRLTLLFIIVAVQIALLVGDLTLRPLPTTFIAAGFNLIGFCGISYWLFLKFPRLACYFFIGGLIVGTAIAYSQFSSPIFMYFFAFICLFASMLLPTTMVVVLALICNVLVIIIGKNAGTGILFSSVFLIWFVVLATFVTFRNLVEALQMAWNYQRYAIAQMYEAREHRAELMKLTKALQEARAELGLANIQLRHAYSAAEEARRLKALFAANVSHEFRTPINLIVGFSEMIVSAPHAYEEPLPRAYYSDLQTVHECAKHLQCLISDVLDIAQVEAGYMAVVKEHCNPRQTILEAANLVRDLIEGAGLTFNVTMPDDLPLLWIDRTRIRQILLNLLSNAVRFTSRGSISLQVSSDTQHLTIAIKDTGIGIRAEDIPHVFDEFYQAGTLDYRHSEGSGLGLTLSKQFVGLHGGSLSVESSGIPGVGSIFTVRLPLENNVLSRTFIPHSKQSGDDNTCFVVMTDDPAVIRLFERYTVSHHVVGAQTIEEVLHLCQTVHPSAIVVGSEHDEARLLEITHNTDYNHIPVILCPMPSGKREIQIYGAADYLVKPITQQTLQAAIQRIDQPVHSILVIDDDQDIARMFSRMLQIVPGVREVWKAYTGQEGLVLMRHQRPDVIILDVLMPDIDGLTTLQIMKRDPALQNIPVIIASASGASEAIAPLTRGRLSVDPGDGFQPIQLVRCVEALLDTFTPTIVPVL
jgi:signal transduction histidine kinase/CheY-like chemotaxis protein